MAAFSLLRAAETLESLGFTTPSLYEEKPMVSISTVLKDGTFVPYGEYDYETVRSLINGNTYRLKISNDRNAKLNNKYHKMIDVVWDNLSDLQQKCYNFNRDCFRHYVEMAAGCVEPGYDLVTHQMTMCRVSTSFDTMSEKEFQELFERVKDVLLDKVLRKCDDEEYKEMIRCF